MDLESESGAREMDGDARGIGEGIEESGRGSLILSRGSSPVRGFGGDQPPVATGSGEQRTDRGGGVLFLFFSFFICSFFYFLVLQKKLPLVPKFVFINKLL